jgi:hypothetical protein
MSETETIVMTEGSMMVGMTVMAKIVLIFLVPVMQWSDYHTVLVASPFVPFK